MQNGYTQAMTLFDAAVLGVIEGLTEFFPISSTGHLILAQKLMGIVNPSLFFNTVIQMGAILAVLVYYHRDVRAIIRETFLQKTGRTIILYAIATLPVLGLGFLFHDLVETLQSTVWIVGATSLAVIPFMIMLGGKAKLRETKPEETTAPSWLQYLRVGMAQAISIIPGISRSGATILGGLSNGWTFADATKTAFLLGIPAMSAASGYELLKFMKHPGQLNGNLLSATAVGFVVSFFIALLTIHTTLPILRKYGFKPFIIYRMILGLGILLLIH